MALHVVVGAGPVGSSVAANLLARGEQVRQVTRSGSGIEGAEKVAANAADGARLAELAAGAVAIYNCVNPPYTAKAWERDWPPVNHALIEAAASTGAVLGITDNLYPYGRVDGPMTEELADHPAGRKGAVRAQMWRDVLSAVEAGRINAFAVRGSDYLGGQSLMSELIAPALRRGRTAYVPADIDAPHTWTSIVDVAELLVTGAMDQRAWGRVWHVPSAPAVSIRELTAIAAAQLGATPKVKPIAPSVFWTAGLVVPVLRELRETQYQWRRPFVLDSTAARETFGLKPAPIEESVALDLAGTRA